jgi:hypothetical protein
MSIFEGKRNERALSDRDIERCVLAWEVLCGTERRLLVVDEAKQDHSRTRFVENTSVVYLGANAYPGEGSFANQRMSMLACLAHELSHAERFARGYQRPLESPNHLIDEAETSQNASFHPALSPKDREDLREDARDRITDWLRTQSNIGEEL